MRRADAVRRNRVAPEHSLPPPRFVIVPVRRDPGGPPRWARRLAFFGALVLLVASVPLLTRVGWRNAITAQGQIAEAAASDPNAPGYRAVVSPTPTMLVVHRGPDGSLGSVALLALAGDSGGGAVLLIPAGVVPDPAAARPRTLAAIYRSGGVEELSTAVSGMLRIGFQSTVTADARDWVAAAAGRSITIANPDDVWDANDELVFEAGEVTLTPEQIEPYLRLRNAGEDERGHIYRAQLLWSAWMAGVASAPGPAGEGDLAAMVASLGEAPVQVLELPVQVADDATLAAVDASTTTQPTADGTGSGAGDGDEIPSDEGTGAATTGDVFVVDLAAVRALVSSLVPFPASAQPGQRVRVRLLDGLGDPTQALNVSTLLVPAGAEIAVFGNADRFDYATSSVEYFDQAQEGNAQALASVLGVASVTLNPAGDASVDVSVVVGRDLAQPGAAPKVTMPSRKAPQG